LLSFLNFNVMACYIAFTQNNFIISGIFGKSENPLLFCFLLLVNLSFFLQIFVSVIGLFLHVDPLYSFLPSIHNNNQRGLELFCFIFRALYFSYGVYTAWQVIGAVIILTIIVLWILRKAVSHLKDWERCKLLINHRRWGKLSCKILFRRNTKSTICLLHKHYKFTEKLTFL
jgi:hypothetical protein